ncbi:MerR family transcriptional regulator [Micromonospora sp. KC606]|uniref:MerR family transcriptional regulator n=1 Tax=Micromonospora sp. KC606 TaxID=2530379 RepID=UPI00104308DA|nr:MerR family transcriptional regulator [Micromonospora sp. KC606]TDC83822.1 MerR family transcriptional regulator [Micromonospora sp. KC606]
MTPRYASRYPGTPGAAAAATAGAAGSYGDYHAEHVRRLKAVKALQREGFNLVAVQAILGARDTAQGGEPVTDAQGGTWSTSSPRMAGQRRGRGSRRSVWPRLPRSALHPRLGRWEVGPVVELLVNVSVHKLATAVVAELNATCSLLRPQ